MNLFGIGFLELALIFLVTFLALGPARTIDMARSAGKLLGDLRRNVNEMTAAADLRVNSETPASPPQQPPSPQPQPPPTGAVPTTGPGEGDEQQERTNAD